MKKYGNKVYYEGWRNLAKEILSRAFMDLLYKKPKIESSAHNYFQNGVYICDCLLVGVEPVIVLKEYQRRCNNQID